MESLARVAQRSRAKAFGSAQHMEAKTSVEFLLPSTCTSTRRDDSFVLFGGKTDRDVRVVAFSTSRNLATLGEYNNWIADGTFYVAPNIFSQSYTIHGGGKALRKMIQHCRWVSSWLICDGYYFKTRNLPLLKFLCNALIWSSDCPGVPEKLYIFLAADQLPDSKSRSSRHLQLQPPNLYEPPECKD